MRKYAIILISVFFAEIAYSQNAVVDSFEQVLSPRVAEEARQLLSRTDISDSVKVHAFQALSYNLLFSKPDSAMELAQQGQSLARRITYPEGVVLCETSIASVWWILGDYAKANEILLDCVNSAESLKDTLSLIWSLSFLISSYRDEGNFEEAMKEVSKAKPINTIWSEKFWNTIIGSVYQAGNKPDSALYFLQRGDSADGWGQVVMGHTYAALHNQPKAAECYRNSLSKLPSDNNYKDLADGYRGLAMLHEHSGNNDSAIHYASKGLEIARTASFKKWVYEISILLSRLYEKKDPAASLSYFKLAIEARDSMFNLQKTTESLNSKYNKQIRQQELLAANISYRGRIRTSILLAALGILIVLAVMLNRNKQRQQKARSLVEKSYAELKATQAMLIQAEKMASLGELTAGIAHEIQNPLNFVNNFSEVNKDLLQDMSTEIDKGNFEEAKIIAANLISNEEKISHHGKRAGDIVKGMLQHSKSSNGQKELTDINALADEYLKLAYHGLRSKRIDGTHNNFNVHLKTDFDRTIDKINIVPQDFGRVLLNLFNNAFYAVDEKSKTAENDYQPVLELSTLKKNGFIEIRIKDNGPGIPEKIIDKIFQPFFTTKPTGQGTGLGLSLAYDIIKAHGGEIKMESKQGEGSVFILELPVS